MSVAGNLRIYDQCLIEQIKTGCVVEFSESFTKAKYLSCNFNAVGRGVKHKLSKKAYSRGSDGDNTTE